MGRWSDKLADMAADLDGIELPEVTAPTRPPVECAKCGCEFHPRRSTAKYCSQACRQAAHVGRPAPDWSRRCPVCDVEMGHKRADARYCSDACRAAASTSRAATSRAAAGVSSSTCGPMIATGPGSGSPSSTATMHTA